MERTPGTHWIGSWVGLRAVLHAVVKRKIPTPAETLDMTSTGTFARKIKQ